MAQFYQFQEKDGKLRAGFEQKTAFSFDKKSESLENNILAPCLNCIFKINIY